MESRSILGMAAACSGAEACLKVALNRQLEERPDELVELLEEGQRRAVAEALPHLAVLEVAAVEDIVDRQANGRPQHVLVLDVEAGNPRDVERLVDLRQ